MTVAAMFFGVTHTGWSRTDGTALCSSMSAAVPLSSEDGGVLPARR